jgi:AcrR family transcriptional regulator
MKAISTDRLASTGRFARRRERTRRELLRASKQVLAAKGYHRTKVTDIAAAADVGVGTFYLYYETKEQLFLELIEETARQLKEAVDTAKARATDPAAKARAGCEAFFRFAQRNRETFRILFGEGAFNQAVRDAQAMFVADVEENFREGMHQGLFAPHPPAVVAQAVIGMLTQVVSWWIAQDEISLEEVIAATAGFATGGIGVAQDRDAAGGRGRPGPDVRRPTR